VPSTSLNTACLCKSEGGDVVVANFCSDMILLFAIVEEEDADDEMAVPSIMSRVMQWSSREGTLLFLAISMVEYKRIGYSQGVEEGSGREARV